MHLKEIFKKKNRQTGVIVNSMMTVKEALVVMNQLGTDLLLVESHTEVIGVFSEKDYTRKVLLLGKAPEQISLSEVMNQKLVTASSAMTLEKCLSLMSLNNITQIPVIENNTYIGMISILDIVEHLIENRDHLIEQLNNYICGGQLPTVPMVEKPNFKNAI